MAGSKQRQLTCSIRTGAAGNLHYSAQLTASDCSAPDGLSAGAIAGAETILFVEDEAFVREVTIKVLRSVGYTVLAATNGAEALRIFQQCPKRADLLLSDIVLPGKSGHALARELRELCPEIVILFISGYGDRMSWGEYEGERAHFLAKPFSMPALLRKVREALDKSNAKPEAAKQFKRACYSG